MRKNAAANREQILVAAEAVFGADGAQGSTEEVARQAGVGIATVFRHFPTKNALIEAALVRHFERLDAQARQLASEGTPADAFRNVVVAMIHSGATKLTLASLVGQSGTFPAEVRDAAQQLRETVEQILDRAKRAGGAQPDVSVHEVYHLIRALAQASATMPPDPTTTDKSIAVVLRGLGV